MQTHPWLSQSLVATTALVVGAALLELSSLLLPALPTACCLLLLLDAQRSSSCGCCWCLPAAGQTANCSDNALSNISMGLWFLVMKSLLLWPSQIQCWCCVYGCGQQSIDPTAVVRGKLHS